MAVQQQKHPLCSAFLVLAFHTAAFIVVFTNTPVLATAARDRQFGGFLFLKACQAKERRGRNANRRLARGKQDIQRSSQTTTATAEAAEIAISVVRGRARV
jgi:hypothetical protein